MKYTEHNQPGRHVFDVCIKRHGLTVTEAADALGVTRNTLSRLLHGRHGISPDMAVRLAHVFGDEPEAWLRLQTDYDLDCARKRVDQRP